MFISIIKLDILTWEFIGTDSLLEPHRYIRGTVGVGYTFQSQQLLLSFADDKLGATPSPSVR